MKKKYVIIICIIGLLSIFPDRVFCGEEKYIALIVSKKIRPYMNVIEGITEGLEEKLKITEVVFLDEGDGFKSVPKGKFDLIAAIGPEAALLLETDPLLLGTDLNLSPIRADLSPIQANLSPIQANLSPIQANLPPTQADLSPIQTPIQTPAKMYTAVLDPDRLFKKPGSRCGISLRIPVKSQVYEISKTFINIKRIGLLFDARNNDWFYEKARLAAKQYNISIIPLAVESRNQITQVLNENWENMDCVWMIPDQTVISEKIIQYIIKLGIYHKKGVIGYNSFFIRSGAVFSFDFDYKALGIQTAEKIGAYFKTGICEQDPPEFQTVVNRKMADRLNLGSGTDLNLSPGSADTRYGDRFKSVPKALAKARSGG